MRYSAIIHSIDMYVRSYMYVHLHISVIIMIFINNEGISEAVMLIKVTAPRLNTLIRTEKLSKDIGYQILGLVLGMILM